MLRYDCCEKEGPLHPFTVNSVQATFLSPPTTPHQIHVCLWRVLKTGADFSSRASWNGCWDFGVSSRTIWSHNLDAGRCWNWFRLSSCRSGRGEAGHKSEWGCGVRGAVKGGVRGVTAPSPCFLPHSVPWEQQPRKPIKERVNLTKWTALWFHANRDVLLIYYTSGISDILQRIKAELHNQSWD